MAGATTTTVTKRVGRVCLGGLLILSMQSNIHGLKSLKSVLFSFSQPNGFAQRKMAIVRLARKNRLFLSKSKYRTLCTITTI